MKVLNSNGYDKKARISLSITRAQTEIEDGVDMALSCYGVTAAQYVVLSALLSGRADTAAQICKEISYSAGAMSRMIDRLEQKDLIRRVVSTDHRRAYKLELTEKGKEVYPKLRESSVKVIDKYFGELNDDELDKLETLISKLQNRI